MNTNVDAAAQVVVLVWEYRVPAASAAEFERRYGPDGDWAQLFRRGAGYLGTQLLRDAGEPGRYVTCDRWRRLADFAAFKATFGAQYAALDAQCDALTEEERALGQFVELG
jgi:heme-degrading monooxygenase HmoA